MKTVIKYLQLPFSFSATAMKAELQAIAEDWKLHYNAKDYDGDWSALALRSAAGTADDVIAYGTGRSYADTSLMQQCAYIKDVVQSFQCPMLSVRLLRLKAGSVIKEHVDKELCFENGEARIHVPIQTNEDVEFYLDGERMHLQEGECWYMNFNLPHRIVNNSLQDRIHLVMDCEVNDWLRDLFAANATKAQMIAVPEKTYTDEERNAMVTALRKMGTETALRMADELEGVQAM